MEIFLYWSHRIFFVKFLRPISPKSIVKRPSYGALHTDRQSDMTFFSVYEIITSPLGLAIPIGYFVSFAL
jgi:hypothetical protein